MIGYGLPATEAVAGAPALVERHAVDGVGVEEARDA